MKREQIIRAKTNQILSTLSLLSSMVNGGEKHSEESFDAVREAQNNCDDLFNLSQPLSEREIEELLFKVYEAGVHKEDCNLTEFAKHLTLSVGEKKGIDLVELERRVDEALANETPGSLKKWLQEQRESEPSQAETEKPSEVSEDLKKILCRFITWANDENADNTFESGNVGQLVDKFFKYHSKWLQSKQSQPTERMREALKKIVFELHQTVMELEQGVLMDDLLSIMKIAEQALTEAKEEDPKEIE